MEKVINPNVKFKDLNKDARKIILFLLRKLIEEDGAILPQEIKNLGLEKVEEVMIEMLNIGLLRLWGNDEGLGLMFYDLIEEEYKRL